VRKRVFAAIAEAVPEPREDEGRVERVDQPLMAGGGAREVPAAICGLRSEQPLDGGLNHLPWRAGARKRERCLAGGPRAGRLSCGSRKGTSLVRWNSSAKRQQYALELVLLLLREQAGFRQRVHTDSRGRATDLPLACILRREAMPFHETMLSEEGSRGIKIHSCQVVDDRRSFGYCLLPHAGLWRGV